MRNEHLLQFVYSAKISIFWSINLFLSLSENGGNFTFSNEFKNLEFAQGDTSMVCKNEKKLPDLWKNFNLFVYKGKELDHLVSSTFGTVVVWGDELDEFWFDWEENEEDDGGASELGAGRIGCSWVRFTSIRPESCWFQLDETKGGKQIIKLTIQQMPMMILRREKG